MRDLIALLSHALKALLTRRTADRHHVFHRSRSLVDEEVTLVRPQHVVWETKRERPLQRERCTAAVLASFGIDYDIETAAA